MKKAHIRWGICLIKMIITNKCLLMEQYTLLLNILYALLLFSKRLFNCVTHIYNSVYTLGAGFVLTELLNIY